MQGTVEIRLARDLSTQALLERGAELDQAALKLALLLPVWLVGRRRWSVSHLRLLSVLLAVLLSAMLSGCAPEENLFTIPKGPQIITVKGFRRGDDVGFGDDGRCYALICLGSIPLTP